MTIERCPGCGAEINTETGEAHFHEEDAPLVPDDPAADGQLGELDELPEDDAIEPEPEPEPPARATPKPNRYRR